MSMTGVVSEMVNVAAFVPAGGKNIAQETRFILTEKGRAYQCVPERLDGEPADADTLGSESYNVGKAAEVFAMDQVAEAGKGKHAARKKLDATMRDFYTMDGQGAPIISFVHARRLAAEERIDAVLKNAIERSRGN